MTLKRLYSIQSAIFKLTKTGSLLFHQIVEVAETVHCVTPSNQEAWVEALMSGNILGRLCSTWPVSKIIPQLISYT